MRIFLFFLFVFEIFFFQCQVLSLNGIALAASGGSPSNCSASGYKTLNSASVAGNCVTFTNGVFQNGAIWACSGINLNQSFKLTFTINFGTNTSSGDGMAFLLQTEGVPQVIGGRGGGLGYAQGDGSACQGGTCPITPSVAVEFDTWNNIPNGLNDIVANHTSIQTNGNMTSGNTLAGPISLLTSGATVVDGANHAVCITWDPGINRYTVFFDGIQRIQYNGNIRAFFANPTSVYWGFTGASGGSAQTQTICSAELLTNISWPTCLCTVPNATATPNPQSICSANATGVTLTSTVAGTTYAWATTANANITGETTMGGSGATITDVLTNTTNTVQTVTYTVTPTASGCVGTAITVPVTVNPSPSINAMTNMVCSGVAFSSTPVNSTNGVVPAGMTYSWSAPVVTGSMTGGTIGSGATSITGTLTNTTNTAQTATYTVTPTSGTCAGTTFTITVTVNPSPVATATPNPQTICSGLATGVILTSNVSNSTFSWLTSANLSIDGESSSSQSSTNITDVLTNIIAFTITLNYTVIPSAAGCSGEAIIVQVNVNPNPSTPTITSTAATCSATGATTISNYVGTETYTFAPSGPIVGAGGVISSMTPGTNYTVTVSNGACNSLASSSFSFESQFSTPSPPLAGTNATYCDNATPDDLTAQGTGTLTWYSDVALSNQIGTGEAYTPSMTIGTTNYFVTQTENGCESSSSMVQITIEECSIIIPTAITPDNDGVNEVLQLQNIDKIYPKNVVTIYNRWGNLIYQSKEGQYELTPWDGYYKNEKLPIGSYYLIIEYNDGITASKTGIVTIIE